MEERKSGGLALRPLVRSSSLPLVRSLTSLMLLDLIEHAAVREVGGLSLIPTAKHVVDGEQGDLGEDLCELLFAPLARAVVVLGRDVLAFFRIEVGEVLRGRLA